MKKNIKISLLTILVFAMSFNFAFAGVDGGALELFLDRLATSSKQNRIDGSNVLEIYLVKNDEVDFLKKEIDIYIKPHHEKELKENGYTIEDVREELEIFRPMSMSNRKKIVKAIRDADTQTIRDILKPNNESKPETPGGGWPSSPQPTDKDKPTEIEVLFKDIKNHRYEAEITKLTKNKIIKGRTEIKFDPDGEITRAEFVTLIDRLINLKAKNTDIPFKDIKPNDWYFDSVKRASDNNIINGKTKDKFEPNSKISREEMATIVMRVLKEDKRLDKLEKTEKNILDYKDHSKISKWAKDNVEKAVEYGVLEDRNKKLEARENGTRAEAVKALDKIFEVMK